MDSTRLPDDEIVYCRIPRAAPWFEKPDEIATANFKLDRRRGDLGLSVYRASVVTIGEVLSKPDAIPGSVGCATTIGEIRQLCKGIGEPLRLDVIATDDESDLGHAEIRGPDSGKLAPAASKALRDLFKVVTR